MKSHALFLVVATAVLLCSGVSSTSLAQEQPEMSEQAIAEMNAWMELAKPGEHHEHLAPFVGKWTSEIKMWMEPGTEPMTESAESEARFILGGRYIEWVHLGSFGGMPFEARQLDAYNNADQRYETTWADNFGTLILSYTGECENDGKVRTLHSEFSDPLGSGATVSQRAVYTWQDEDHWTYESYMTMGGVEFQNMEILYTRVD